MGWRTQWFASGMAAHGITIGPNAGTSVTSIRNLAVQRDAPHICGEHSRSQWPVASTQ
jgi:hypothetical protein